MTGDDAKLLWVYMSEMWDHYRIPASREQIDVRVTVWLDVLGDLDAGAVRAAVAALGDEPHPPKVGQIRARALELLGSTEVVPDVDEAWAEVTEQLARVGSWGKPTWSHPAVAATVAALDWREVCASENLGVLRGQFVKLYGTASGRMQRETANPAPIVGKFLAALPAVRSIGEGQR